MESSNIISRSLIIRASLFLLLAMLAPSSKSYCSPTAGDSSDLAMEYALRSPNDHVYEAEYAKILPLANSVDIKELTSFEDDIDAKFDTPGRRVERAELFEELGIVVQGGASVNGVSAGRRTKLVELSKGVFERMFEKGDVPVSVAMHVMPSLEECLWNDYSIMPPAAWYAERAKYANLWLETLSRLTACEDPHFNAHDHPPTISFASSDPADEVKLAKMNLVAAEFSQHFIIQYGLREQSVVFKMVLTRLTGWSYSQQPKDDDGLNKLFAEYGTDAATQAAIIKAESEEQSGPILRN